MACYILWALVQLVWLCLAPVWVSDHAGDADCATASELALALMAINWAYLGLGFTFFACSWCCSCCDDHAQQVNRDLERAMQPANVAASMGASLGAHFFGGNSKKQAPVVQGRPVR